MNQAPGSSGNVSGTLGHHGQLNLKSGHIWPMPRLLELCIQDQKSPNFAQSPRYKAKAQRDPASEVQGYTRGAGLHSGLHSGTARSAEVKRGQWSGICNCSEATRVSVVLPFLSA